MKHLSWVWLAIRLALWIVLALLAPLLLGLLFDYITGLSPLGLLLGLFAGMLIGILFIIRTIQARFLALAPAELEDAKERS